MSILPRGNIRGKHGHHKVVFDDTPLPKIRRTKVGFFKQKLGSYKVDLSILQVYFAEPFLFFESSFVLRIKQQHICIFDELTL